MFPSLPQTSNTTEGPAFNEHNTPYEALGGDHAVRALVDCFYDSMHRDPRFARIRALHKPDLADARQKLYEFLCGWLGGPQLYIQKHGHPRLRARHTPFAIGELQRDQWLACMASAMNERNVSGEIRAFLDSRFRHVADFMRNQEQ